MEDIPERFLRTLNEDDVDAMNMYLVEAGDVTQDDLYKYLTLTVLSDCFRCFTSLMAHVNIHHTMPAHQPPLHLTVMHGRILMTEFLLNETHADINMGNSSKETGLMIAVKNQDYRMVKLFLSQGAELSRLDCRGRNALHLIARSGCMDIAQLVLSICSQLDIAQNLNRGDLDGLTPLMYSAIEGYEMLVQLMLDRGAIVTMTDDKNKTACHWAARRGHLLCLQMLIKYGSDIFARDRDKRTPLVLAVERGHRDVVTALLYLYIETIGINDRPVETCAVFGKLGQRYQCDLAMALLASIAENHPPCARLMLEYGTPPDTKATSTYDGSFVPLSYSSVTLGGAMKEHHHDSTWLCSPIHIAAARSNEECMQCLLQFGADPNKKDSDDNTALMYATGKGCLTIIKELLSHNADPDIQGKLCGITCSPFDVAATFGYTKIMMCLAIAGAHVSVSTDWMNSKSNSGDHQHVLYQGKISWLCNFVCHPKPLRDICRKQIRKQLQLNVHEKIAHLHVPRQLKDYILIRELEEII